MGGNRYNYNMCSTHGREELMSKIYRTHSMKVIVKWKSRWEPSIASSWRNRPSSRSDRIIKKWEGNAINCGGRECRCVPVRLSHLVSLTWPWGLNTAAWSLPLPGIPPTGRQKSPGNRASKEIIIAIQRQPTELSSSELYQSPSCGWDWVRSAWLCFPGWLVGEVGEESTGD